jgi:hypothetical protein
MVGSGHLCPRSPRRRGSSHSQTTRAARARTAPRLRGRHGRESIALDCRLPIADCPRSAPKYRYTFPRITLTSVASAQFCEPLATTRPLGANSRKRVSCGSRIRARRAASRIGVSQLLRYQFPQEASCSQGELGLGSPAGVKIKTGRRSRERSRNKARGARKWRHTHST